MSMAAVVVGLGLMLMQSLLQLSRAARGANLAWALGCLLVLGAALHWASPFLMNFGHGNLLLFFVLMVGVCVVMGLPIAFAFGLCTLAYLQFSTSTPLTTRAMAAKNQRCQPPASLKNENAAPWLRT